MFIFGLPAALQVALRAAGNWSWSVSEAGEQNFGCCLHAAAAVQDAQKVRVERNWFRGIRFRDLFWSRTCGDIIHQCHPTLRRATVP